MLEKTWRYKTIALLVSLTLILPLSLSGWSLMSTLAQANARLNGVDKFVQTTTVTPNPAFVETGVSATTLTIDATHVARVTHPATAHTEILAPDTFSNTTGEHSEQPLVGNEQSTANSVSGRSWE